MFVFSFNPLVFSVNHKISIVLLGFEYIFKMSWNIFETQTIMTNNYFLERSDRSTVFSILWCGV